MAADPDGVASGATLTVIGYGVTAPGDPSAAARRAGTSMVASVDAATIATVDAPSQTCEGDSGGPAISSSNVIVGVASSGDVACATGAVHTRVAAHRAFVDGAVAASADGAAAPGARCWYGANCSGGATCAPALDEPRWSFCAPACDASGGCPAGLACLADSSGVSMCRHDAPSPGAIGAACASKGDCASAVCATSADGGPSVCTDACFPDLPGFCPEGYACTAAQGGSDACFAAPARANGCDAGGNAAPWIFLALLTIRSRRGSR
jgi:hypothetical protein